MIVEIIKCDICDNQLDYGDVKTEISYRNGRCAHLCRECTRELNIWLLNARVKRLRDAE